MLYLDKIRKELGDLFLKCDEDIEYSIRAMIEKFVTMQFKRFPYLNQLTDRIYDKIDPSNVSYYTDNCILPIYNSDCDSEELREKQHNIDMEKTLTNILAAYPDTVEYHYKAGRVDEAILFNEEFVYFDGIFYMNTPSIPQEMYDCIIEKEDSPRIRWVLRNNRGGIDTKYMDILPKGDIESNYNEDFIPVHDKIQRLIRDDKSSIIILHGKPGTGKTSYIRDLISMNSDLKFYWVDSSMFNYVDCTDFVQYLASCKNGVFILEDSEVLLTSREEGRNPAMQSLLSISDGMLGDSLKLKFICTFNTELKKIDNAILRKGRMSIKYEFRNLSKDKVAKILEKQGIDVALAREMPLCDVYNFLEDNGNKTTNERKIGFS